MAFDIKMLKLLLYDQIYYCHTDLGIKESVKLEITVIQKTNNRFLFSEIMIE